MVRFVIIGIVIAVAFTLYALVDAAMTDASRARGVSKPIWIVLIVLLPIIGAALWFLIGKGSPQSQARSAQARRSAPDDDPRFTGTRLSKNDLDAHMRDLEDRLRELDNETFPGEESRPAASAADAAPDHAEDVPEAPTLETPATDPTRGAGRSAVDPDPAPETATEADSASNSDARDARSGDAGKRPDGDTAS